MITVKERMNLSNIAVLILCFLFHFVLWKWRHDAASSRMT